MSEFREILSQIVLAITATTLFYMAMKDLREFKIRNELVIALACLYGIYTILSGQWVSAHWNLALALFMFVVLLIFYGRNWLGGGDVKILTVGFLWVGIRYALPFAFLLLAFSLMQVVAAKFEWIKVLRVDNRVRMAFAPSVAAALIGVFMLQWSGF